MIVAGVVRRLVAITQTTRPTLRLIACAPESPVASRLVASGCNVGACGVDEPSMREWLARGRTGHEETDTLLLQQQGMSRLEAQRVVLGHVLCHRERGRGWVEWTNQRAGVYALATGPSSETLAGWWKTAAGPLTLPEPLVSGGAMEEDRAAAVHSSRG